VIVFVKKLRSINTENNIVASSTSLRIIFAGTPALAAVTLLALIHSPHRLIAVYTQPDRPAGRGLRFMPSPVKQLALQHALPIYQPTTLKGEEQATLARFHADAIIVAAYGMLLPTEVLAIPRYGCINIHPSLLPRWRGAAPIERALLAGDKVSGVTIMQMDAGLDTGPILLQHDYLLSPDETAQTLHDRLAQMGARSLLETLDLLVRGNVCPQSQDSRFATYAHKITKEEALIDWACPAIELERKIRAFNPRPVAHVVWQGKALRIWQAKAFSLDRPCSAPGTILSASHDGIDVMTGVGMLRLLEVQLPGGKVVSAADFYNARRAELITGRVLA
jgi:methionyl-tRNA formyltransferase